MLLVTANIFQPLIDVFESVLKFFHNSIGIPWGWAIVLLTICVRAILVPLTVRQIRSMARMQQLAPELKSIQAKYKDDKQRQQQEVMKFYKENNVNPLGSCLPLAAQLPVFISLFYMLREDLRINICPQTQLAYQASHHVSSAHTIPCGPNNGANFLFISDITNKATGLTLLVLIVLYVGTQLASSLMMASPTMDKTQRQIMTFMPLVFVFVIINFPAGLLVYWITTNTWTMGQQYFIKRAIGPPAPATPGGDGGGGPGGGGGPNGGSGPNGSGSGGIGALLRGGRAKQADEDGEAKSSARSAGASGRGGSSSSPVVAPPRPPRKKKKRSGRRR